MKAQKLLLEDCFHFIRNGISVKQNPDKGGLPITRIETISKAVIDVGRVGFADIEEHDLGKYEDYLLLKGDILMSHINSMKYLGKSAIYENEPEKIIHGMNLLCLRPKIEVSNPKYLYYFFSSGLFKRQLPKISNQSVNQASFPAGKLKKLKIPLPPLETQKRIAQILDNAAALCDKTAQLLKEYDLLAQSIFLDMFGDPRLNTKEWKVEVFKDLANNFNFKRVPIKQSDRDKIQGKYPYYGATGIVDYIDDFIFEGQYLLIAEDGKNLINRKKPIAWVVKGQFWVNNHAHVITNNEKSNLTFLAFHFNHMDISNYVTGIDQFKLNRGNLDRMQFMNPPIKLQNQFAEKIELIEEQKELAKQELQESEDLFNCLLQKAFKGELA